MYVANHDNATVSIVRDAPSGIEELTPEVGVKQTIATVAGGTLFLRRPDPAVLVDASGRVAAKLEPGSNSVGHLRRGVYFVRGLSTPGTCKVIILN
jgi:hypothetical protein